ncbi:hypothetical protein LCGC14_1160630, partial [marine sediment metagenome]
YDKSMSDDDRLDHRLIDIQRLVYKREAYIHVRISKNRAKLPRPAHAPYRHPCRQQRVNRP